MDLLLMTTNTDNLGTLTIMITMMITMTMKKMTMKKMMTMSKWVWANVECEILKRQIPKIKIGNNKCK